MDARIIAAVVAVLVIIVLMLSTVREKFCQHINWRYVGPPQIPPVWRSW